MHSLQHAEFYPHRLRSLRKNTCSCFRFFEIYDFEWRHRSFTNLDFRQNYYYIKFKINLFILIQTQANSIFMDTTNTAQVISCVPISHSKTKLECLEWCIQTPNPISRWSVQSCARKGTQYDFLSVDLVIVTEDQCNLMLPKIAHARRL